MYDNEASGWSGVILMALCAGLFILAGGMVVAVVVSAIIG